MAVSVALARSAAMTDATRALLSASELMFAADETAAGSSARLARVVRRELDGLNTGLDVAFQRMRTLEAVLEKQISSLDDAGARAQVRSDTIAARLNQESTRIETLGDHLTEAAGRAGETVAGRAAQLKATMELAEGTLENGGPVAGCAGGRFPRRHHHGGGIRRWKPPSRWKPRRAASRTWPMPPWRAPNSCWRGMKSIAPR